MKNTVTIEEVLDNMKDIIVETRHEFDKPFTYVTVKMKNGFTLRESTTCVDPSNYDEEIGKRICLDKIKDKIWFLLGYALKDKLYTEEQYKLSKKITTNNSVICLEANPTQILYSDRIIVRPYDKTLKQIIDELYHSNTNVNFTTHNPFSNQTITC